MQTTKELTAIDVAMLLKLLANQDNPLKQTELSEQLYIAQSEVSRSISRLDYAQLYSKYNKSVNRLNTFEFLVYGVKYAFPVQPGSIVRGIPTAHSAPPLSDLIISQENYVWAYAKGTIRGQHIEPFYKNLPKASLVDSKFYGLLALIDTLRVGKQREIAIAKEKLEQNIIHGK
ncbi:MarR family transcriptional regulator [Leeuwenhoekiella blandensis]|uniref:Uncharacterized protein n=1 Tax=Leeuwenhoekiella blandensis (strain CECT 7118 / CCUG 51940 / KCTC 22103 / MED217) TaxID=398720 RepID=A3XRE4_LEEBM|nr:MarR family transcriptional regulator [Leeuwenhoekiella blandensis]EAQ47877.1 hypothetical protein MED217_18566 [Leeuwenhoekiella blandensis MED217]